MKYFPFKALTFFWLLQVTAPQSTLPPGDIFLGFYLGSQKHFSHDYDYKTSPDRLEHSRNEPWSMMWSWPLTRLSRLLRRPDLTPTPSSCSPWATAGPSGENISVVSLGNIWWKCENIGHAAFYLQLGGADQSEALLSWQGGVPGRRWSTTSRTTRSPGPSGRGLSRSSAGGVE